MNGQEIVNQTGWGQKIKDSFNLTSMMDKLGQYKELIFEVLLYGGIGFLVGFLFKKYSGCIVLLIGFLVGLFILYRFDILVVVVNWDKLHELFGIKALTAGDADMTTALWDLIRNNITITVSFVIGFLIGLRFG